MFLVDTLTTQNDALRQEHENDAIEDGSKTRNFHGKTACRVP